MSPEVYVRARSTQEGLNNITCTLWIFNMPRGSRYQVIKEFGLKDHDYYGFWGLIPDNLVSGPSGMKPEKEPFSDDCPLSPAFAGFHVIFPNTAQPSEGMIFACCRQEEEDVDELEEDLGHSNLGSRVGRAKTKSPQAPCTSPRPPGVWRPNIRRRGQATQYVVISTGPSTFQVT